MTNAYKGSPPRKTNRANDDDTAGSDTKCDETKCKAADQIRTVRKDVHQSRPENSSQRFTFSTKSKQNKRSRNGTAGKGLLPETTPSMVPLIGPAFHGAEEVKVVYKQVRSKLKSRNQRKAAARAHKRREAAEAKCNGGNSSIAESPRIPEDPYEEKAQMQGDLCRRIRRQNSRKFSGKTLQGSSLASRRPLH